MKTTQVFVAIFLLLTTVSLTASDTKDKDKLKRSISNHIHHPGSGQEGVVYAHIVVNEEGGLDIKEIDSTDESLLGFVTKKLQELHVKITDSGEERRLHFIFKKDSD